MLSKKRVRADEFQLLGISALYLAMKMDEVELRRVTEFAFYTENAVSASQIAVQERQIVQTLNFNILPDTLYFWVDLLMDQWDSFALVTLELSTQNLFKRAQSNLS